MAHAIFLHAPGDASTLSWESASVGKPGAHEVLVRHQAIGLNYIDTYHRSGLYPLPSYPAILGLEAAGVVEACGERVTYVKPGDRVAYCNGPTGAYSESRLIEERFLVKLPDAIDVDVAAAIMVKGLTAHYLLRQTFPVRSGDTILVHAASGGVGLMMCQWARHIGAIVIGTVSTATKADIAYSNGCDYPIIYSEEDVPSRVLEITNGHKADVVYDSVGKDTFHASLDCLRPLGMIVSYGQSSGPVPPFDIGLLARKGSLYLTRPSLMHYIDNPADMRASAQELFSLVAQGILKVHIGQRYALKDAALAHRELESRRTVGASLLIP